MCLNLVMSDGVEGKISSIVIKLRRECKKRITVDSRENVDYDWIIDHVELFGRDQLVHRVAVSESYQLRSCSSDRIRRGDGYYGVGWVMNGQTNTCMICDGEGSSFERSIDEAKSDSLYHFRVIIRPIWSKMPSLIATHMLNRSSCLLPSQYRTFHSFHTTQASLSGMRVSRLC